MGISIKLTYSEMQVACLIASQRQIQNMKFKAKGAHGNTFSDMDSFSKHVMGCIGEMAAAKYLNKYWCGAIGDYNAGDVGNYQVRSTMYKKDTRLILHPEDEGEAWVLALVNADCSCDLLGWTDAKSGKNKDYWCDYGKTGRPAFFVPQSALQPMETLQ